MGAEIKSGLETCRTSTEARDQGIKELEVLTATILGLARQTAEDRWDTGQRILEAASICKRLKRSFEDWCNSIGIAHTTARQAKTLHKKIPRDQIKGITVTQALVLTGQVKKRKQSESDIGMFATLLVGIGTDRGGSITAGRRSYIPI